MPTAGGRKLDANVRIPVVPEKASAKPCTTSKPPEAFGAGGEKAALNKPEAPQQPVALEGRLRQCDPATLQILKTILGNIEMNPWDGKYRTLHGSNGKITPLLMDAACVEVLVSRCGFEPQTAGAARSFGICAPPIVQAAAAPVVRITADGQVITESASSTPAGDPAVGPGEAADQKKTGGEGQALEGGDADVGFVFSPDCMLVLPPDVQSHIISSSKQTVSKALEAVESQRRARAANGSAGGAPKKVSGRSLERAAQQAERDRILLKSRENQSELRGRRLAPSKVVAKQGDSAKFVRCEQIGINTGGTGG